MPPSALIVAAAPCTHRDHNGRRCQGTATGRAQVAGERHHHAALCPEHLTRQHAIVALGLRWALRKDLLGEYFFVIRRWRAFPHNR